MLCSQCGTEHDRHCPCHKPRDPLQPINEALNRAAVDPARAKFAKRCPRCGNDEWFLRRTWRKCTKCGLEHDISSGEVIPPNAFYEWRGVNDSVSVMVDKAAVQVPPEAVEQLKKALAEGKDEKIIRLPLLTEVDYRIPMDERIKLKALSEPTGKLPCAAVCYRCSRQISSVPAVQADRYLCVTCAKIELIDSSNAVRFSRSEADTKTFDERCGGINEHQAVAICSRG